MDSAKLAEQFRELNQAWLQDRTEKTDHDLAARENRVRDLGMEITKLWREIIALRRDAKGLHHVSREQEPDYRLEFDRLLGMAGIRSLDIGAGFLALATDTIVIEHQGKRYRIGDFRLEIYLNGFIRMANVKNPGRYPYYDHPHIRDGAACVGNHTEAVAKLIAEGQLSTVAAILLSYLHSYNPEDAYCEIAFWPEATGND